MKRFITAITFIAVIILSFFFLFRYPFSQKLSSDTPRFTFIAPKEWNRIASGASQADREFQTNTKYILYSQDGESTQAEAIRYAWMTGADGIITAGMTNSSDTEEVIRQVQSEGIPVVFVDSDLEGSGRACYFGCNNYEVGRMAGEALKNSSGGEADVCLVFSYLDNANQQERRRGLEDAIADMPGIRITSIIEGKSEAMLLREQLTEVFREHPEINTIVCAEGVATNCCNQILEGNNLDFRDYHIISMHYSEFNLEDLEKGVFDGMVWQDQFQMGYEAVKYLKESMTGEQTEETTQYVGLRLLTKDNIDADALWKQEEVEWHIF